MPLEPSTWLCFAFHIHKRKVIRHLWGNCSSPKLNTSIVGGKFFFPPGVRTIIHGWKMLVFLYLTYLYVTFQEMFTKWLHNKINEKMVACPQRLWARSCGPPHVEVSLKCLQTFTEVLKKPNRTFEGKSPNYHTGSPIHCKSPPGNEPNQCGTCCIPWGGQDSFESSLRLGNICSLVPGQASTTPISLHQQLW